MIEITSRDNQHIKKARLVRDGRDREFVHVEGVRLVEEAINSGCVISNLFVETDATKDEWIRNLIARIESTSTDVYEVSTPLIRHISDTENPQGVVAIAARPASGRSVIEQRVGLDVPLVVLLEEANNPSNIGAIIRSAEAAGIAGFITSTGSADAFSPKSIRASMGSCFRLPIWERVQVDKVLAWAERSELAVIGLSGAGGESIYEVDWQKPTLLIAGSEAHGISTKLHEKLHFLVQIPMSDAVESLNLAAACSITMFEARRHVLRLGK